MNIGNTPQEQLATIRHIYKRVLIFGFILCLPFARPAFSAIPEIEAALSIPPALCYVLTALGTLLLGMFCSLAYVWAFYWLKGKIRPGSLAAIGVAAVATANSGNTYEVYRDSISGDITVTKKTNWLPLVIVAVLFFYISCFVGLFFAIKYAILGFKLKKNPEAESEKKIKTTGIKISPKTVKIAVCVGIALLLVGIPLIKARIKANSYMAAVMAQVSSTIGAVAANNATPIVAGNTYMESFSHGTLNNEWQQNGYLTYSLEGLNGMKLARGDWSSSLELTSVFLGAMCDYIIEFEAMAEDDRDIFRCYIAKDESGAFSDVVYTDYGNGFASMKVNDTSTVEFKRRPTGEFYSIRIEVKNKQVSLYMDDIILATETVNGVKPTLSFQISDWNNYFIRNLRVAFPAGTTPVENFPTNHAISASLIVFGQAMETISGTVEVPYGSHDGYSIVETRDDMEYAVIDWRDGWIYDSRTGEYCRLETPTKLTGDFLMDGGGYNANITIVFKDGKTLSGDVNLVCK